MSRPSIAWRAGCVRAAAAAIVMFMAVALVTGPAAAQTREAELAACAAIDREQARLACYDRVIRGGEPDASGAAVAPPPAPAAPARDRTAVPEPSPRAAEPVVTPVAEPPPVPASEPAAAARVAAAPETVPVEEFPQTRSERRAARRAERSEAEPFSVIIVQHVENLSGLGVFVGDNGEIYDQVSTRRSRYPEVPFAADLAPASRGSFWLTTEEGSRPVRVVPRD